jgi:hypothetical protein
MALQTMQPGTLSSPESGAIKWADVPARPPVLLLLSHYARQQQHRRKKEAPWSWLILIVAEAQKQLSLDTEAKIA